MNDTDIVKHLHGVTIERLHVWVQRGWVRPVASSNRDQFTAVDLARAAFIRDLQDDLGLEESAVPIVLNLVDQIHGLRQELRGLLEAVDAQPHAVRSRLLAHIERRRTKQRRRA